MSKRILSGLILRWSLRKRSICSQNKNFKIELVGALKDERGDRDQQSQPDHTNQQVMVRKSLVQSEAVLGRT